MYFIRYWTILSEYEIRTDKTIKERLDQLHAYYSKKENRIKVSFNDPVTRFAYIFLYTTAHANYAYNIIRASEVLQNVFDRKVLKVSCIGGGPGSDLLGILQYLNLENTPEQLRSLICYLCDKEEKWRESWCDIGSKLDSDFPCSVHTVPWVLDVFDEEGLAGHKKIFDADFFTMIYFFSDPGIFEAKEDTRAFFEYWFAKAKPGALFLFIDNAAWKFYSWFDDMASQCGLEIVEKDDCLHILINWREEKRDLGIYFEKFGDPKIQSDIACRVYRKPSKEGNDLDDW